MSGELLRRGIPQNDIPVKQVFAYVESFEDYDQLDNPTLELENDG